MAFFSSCQHRDWERHFTLPHISGSSVDQWADVHQGADSLPSPLHNIVPSHHCVVRYTRDCLSISDLLQNIPPTAPQHLFNTLPFTPLTLYKQINPHKQQHTLHACWQAHTLVLHSHILGPATCARTHTLLSGPVGVLLCSSSQRERSSLWACCGEEGQMLWAWPHAVAAAETHQDYLCLLSLI